MQFIPLALSTIGAISEGEQQGKALNQAGDVAFANAQNVRQQGNANEETSRRRAQMQLGSGRASAAESGFQSSSGSIVDIQSANAAELELDVLTERYKNEFKAIEFVNQGNAYRTGAKNARTQGYMKAFDALISGTAKSFGAPRTDPPAPIETRKIN
jgi:hypothetical protein